MVRGFLFDIDGTLLDSNDAHASAWVQALYEYGWDVTFADVRRLIGKGGDHILAELCGLDSERGTGKAIVERRKQLFKAQLECLKPMRGARDLIETLRARGVKLVVATSAAADEVTPLLEQAGVADLFEGATHADDVDQSKPDPDVVLAALRKIGLPKRDVVFVGDTPYDVAASLRAGVRAVALRCGAWDDRALRGAVAIYDDPQDMLAHLDDLLEEDAFRRAST